MKLKQSISILSKSNNIRDINNHLMSDVNNSSDRGFVFENIIGAYMATDSDYEFLYSPVSDAPNELLTKYGIPSKDKGIDFLGIKYNGVVVAGQVKFKENVCKKIKMVSDRVSNTISLAEKVKDSGGIRLLVTNAYGISDSLVGVREQFEVIDYKILNKTLDRNRINAMISYLKCGQKSEKNIIRNPYDYQEQAINSVIKELYTRRNRCQINLPCGAGKSLIGARIIDRINGDISLFFAPTISLCHQLATDFKDNTSMTKDSYRVMVVSSGNMKDESEYDDESYVTETTTDVSKVVQFLKGKLKKILVCTYSSAGNVLGQALIAAKKKASVAIFDEAHNLAIKAIKSDDSITTSFSAVLYDEYVPIHKRVFQTATRKVFTINGANGNNLDILSMDNELLFGRLVYTMNYKEAVDKGVIVPIVLYASLIHNNKRKELKKTLIKLPNNLEAQGEIASRAISSLVAIEDIKTRIGRNPKAILFAGRIEAAESYDLFWKLNGYDSYYISSKVKGNDRTNELINFGDSQNISILNNPIAASEGINIPKTDIVFINAPTKSVVRNIQQMGRCNRASLNKSRGYCVIPVMIEDNEDLLLAGKDTGYNTLINLFLTLMQMNGSLDEVINLIKDGDSDTAKSILKANLTRTVVIKNDRKIADDKYSTDELLFNKLYDSISFEIYDMIHNYLIDPWMEWYNLLCEYKNYFGHCDVPYFNIYKDRKLGIWCSSQRQAYKGTTDFKLSQNRIELLNNIGFKWSFDDDKEQQWMINYNSLCEYKDEFNNCDVKSKEIYKNINLGSWCQRQRLAYKRIRGTLSENQINLLNDIGFKWSFDDDKEQQWMNNYISLLNYFNKYKHCNIPQNEEYDGKKLGQWCMNQRQAYKGKGFCKITPGQIELLNKIGFNWNPGRGLKSSKFKLQSTTNLKQSITPNSSQVKDYYERLVDETLSN